MRGTPRSSAKKSRFSRDGEVAVERERLRHVADARLDGVRVGHDGVAEDEASPRRGREHGREHPDERRLAGAVGSDEAEDLAASGPSSDDVVDGRDLRGTP